KAAHNYGRITNPADTPAGGFDPQFYSAGAPPKNNGVPDTLYVPNVGSEFVTPNGVLLNAATFLPQFSFDKAGRLVPVPVRTGFNSFAFGQLPENCVDCYYPEDFTQLVSPNKQFGGDLRIHYDFNDHLHAFVDAKF